MAIDGIKIIDSDLAYDIRNAIMEAYDYGEPLSEVTREIESWEADFSQKSIDYEIFITAYVQTLWEIGQLPEKWLQKAQSIVAQGASEQWNKIDPNAQEKRQKTLEKFLEKIEKPNEKPRKSKNYKKISDFFFQKDEVFAVKLPDNTFGFVILVEIYHQQGQCYYSFAKLNYVSEHIPSLDFLKNQYVYARKGLGFDSNKSVTHKNLAKFKDEFQSIGTLAIDDAKRRFGTYSGAIKNLEEFTADWNEAPSWGKSQYRLLEFLKQL